ncbi:MAG: methionyl-tRNA formyltransferase [Planctomycetota bacterium]
MRTVFLGSPPFATPILERLVASPHRPVCVVTQPERPRGRGRKVQPSPVAEIARREEIELLQPDKATDPAFHARLRELEPDVFFVVSYGKILREDLLAIPRDVSLNVHPSLLPRHRGATPIQAALLSGDEVTGVTIQKMAQELDAGDVLLAVETPVEPHEHAGELAERLAVASAEASVAALDLVASGDAVYTPQDPERVTFCRKLEKEHGWIDWSLPAAELHRHVRGMTPWPGARTRLPGGAELAVTRAAPVDPGDAREPGRVLEAERRFLVACGDGSVLELTEVKPAGKRAMAAADYLRGARLEAGVLLEAPA